MLKNDLFSYFNSGCTLEMAEKHTTKIIFIDRTFTKVLNNSIKVL